MKPKLRKATPSMTESFIVRKDLGSEMANDWHYHPEIELLFIKRSSGTWMIGGHVGHFQSGDVVLLGPNVPHCYRHEYEYIQQNERATGEAIGVLFLQDILGSHFLNIPENKIIKDLLDTSNKGLKLTGKTKKTTADIITTMLYSSPCKRLIFLLSILELIADDKEFETLNFDHILAIPNRDHERLKLIFEYTFTNYQNKISIEEMASLVYMSRHSFCRFFKSRTRKTFIHFLMEVRIGQACRLLAEDKFNIWEISYICGYKNISHFNHQFRLITNRTPSEYKEYFT